MTAVQSTAPASKFRTPLSQRWQRLIEPDASIQDPGTRRQVQLTDCLHPGVDTFTIGGGHCHITG